MVPYMETKEKKPFNVCGIMWVIKTMHDGKIITQSMS